MQLCARHFSPSFQPELLLDSGGATRGGPQGALGSNMLEANKDEKTRCEQMAQCQHLRVAKSQDKQDHGTKVACSSPSLVSSSSHCALGEGILELSGCFPNTLQELSFSSMMRSGAFSSVATTLQQPKKQP